MSIAIDLRRTEWTPASDDVLADLIAFFGDGEGLIVCPEIVPAIAANDNWVIAPPMSQQGEWPHPVWRSELRTAD